MALILNIETATTVCSVSIAKNGQIIALKEQDGDYSHSEKLTLFIQEVCLQANIKLADFDAVAVSKGPGSYTGLRIGVSTAKGLCYSLNIPLIAINTLKHLTLSKKVRFNLKNRATDISSIVFCPMLDARRMEVYCGLYDTANNEIKPTEAKIINEESFSDLLKESHVFFFGDGATKCKQLLSVNKNAHFIDNITPSAANMISISEEAYQRKTFEDVAYFEPFYLKDFMAGKTNLIK